MKVVINKCYGGFSLSGEAYEWLIKNKNWTITEISKNGIYENPNADLVRLTHPIYSFRDTAYSPLKFDIENDFRSDPEIIEVVETLGKNANGLYADLKIIEIPDDIDWEIGEYDGEEWIQEVTRRWD